MYGSVALWSLQSNLSSPHSSPGPHRVWSVELEVWTFECGVSVECRVFSFIFKILNFYCGVWSECRKNSLKFKLCVRSVEC